MLNILIIIYMSVTSAWSGGSLWGHQFFPLKWLPEALFSLGFMYALFPLVSWWSILAALWAYIWMQTGHANALPWGKGGHNPDRENTLSPVVKEIADLFKIEHFSTNYARLFMSIKGFLITLPVGGTGFLFWPLGYEIGHRLKNHTVSEMAAGAGAGVSIVIFLLIT